jgi:hypothetical protein
VNGLYLDTFSMQIEQQVVSGISSYLICFTQYADHPSFSRQHSIWYPNISMMFSKKAMHLVGPSSSYDILEFFFSGFFLLWSSIPCDVVVPLSEIKLLVSDYLLESVLYSKSSLLRQATNSGLDTLMRHLR